MREIKVVDLFCGCGGMSLGFQNMGFDVVAAFDHWKPALDVYRDNFEHNVFECDLYDSSAETIVQDFNPDLIIGGPPCQDFSSAGLSNHSSDRAWLINRYVDCVEAAQPEYFVMENVPRARLRPVFKAAVSRLRSLGYGLSSHVLDASYCGVPQHRKRLFLVGAVGAEDGFLESYVAEHLSDTPMSLREYFGGALDTDYYFRVPTNYGRRGVFSVDEPSLTIRAVDRPIPPGYTGHPEDPVAIGPQVRTFTVLERSYIQTFPHSFKFKGTKTNLNMMIGNAVPVKLAEFVANALKQYINENHIEYVRIKTAS
ncbi:DNA cytosine methyltransferase [Pseudodesulfovibrio methanolicus]|uniref:Cytosine-specific methyltransferase n=1 Tax=Pseudodesulfovibrio methanolicus TaxID=3126690 RepID=A0ABZ2J208_9BACT